MNRNELKKLLSQDYSYSNWKDIYEYLFPNIEFFHSPAVIEHNDSDKIVRAQQIGYISLKDGSQVAFFEVEVPGDVQIARNRVHLNNIISRWIVSGGIYSAAIGIFYAKGQPDYRFTFAMRGARFTEDMKVEEVKTNPKRYTYVLGSNEKCETASRRFEELTRKGVALRLEDIEDAFSVEKLNKEFFRKVADSFYKLVGGTLEKQNYTPLLQLPKVDYEKDKKNEQQYQKFAVRLIGRIVFCWFLKLKKSESGKSLIPEELLSKEAVEKTQGYYKNILEKLFFECLNTPIEQRKEDILPHASDIPFLNGGLFEPKQADYYKMQDIAEDYLLIPNDWFLAFFETLEQYNFTIDENSIFDADISVDPEILGRIFENLLAEINPETGETARKSTGSYYTPREIVDYMVAQSLVETLNVKTGIDSERLKRLFSYEEQISDNRVEFTDDEKEKISKELHQIKVLDPACGSGAFPMGILHKTLYGLEQVDPHAKRWVKNQFNSNANAGLINEVQKKDFRYQHKLNIVQHSIYGVDIQPIAVEISKLRFFLSLVVDEKVNDSEKNRGIKPLPNLDFKFVAANSLIPAPTNHHKDELDFGNVDPFFTRFDELTKQYFYADTKEGKSEIRAELESVVNLKIEEKRAEINNFFTGISRNNQSIINAIKKQYEKRIASLEREKQLWESYKNIFTGETVAFFEPRYFFPEVSNGFDIVIGNPPYQRIQGIAESTPLLVEEYKRIFSSAIGAYDLYVLFAERGLSLCAQNGIVNYILPHKWTNSGFGKGLRQLIAEHKNLYKMISFGAYQVFNASTYSSLLWLKEQKQANYYYYEFGHDLLNNVQLGNSLSILKESDFVCKNTSDLSSDVWILAKPHVSTILDKISQHPRTIKDVFKKIFVGLQTSKDTVFFFQECIENDDYLEGFSKELGNRVIIEKGIMKPLLKGEQIHRYVNLKTDNYVLFPYDISSNGNAQIMDSDVIKTKFPKAWDYLVKFESLLRGRESGNFNDEEWYRYGRNQGIDFGNIPKLLAPDISLKGQFSYDGKGLLYQTATVYGYIKRDDIKESYKFFLAIFNSSLLWFYLKNTGTVLRGGYFRFKPNYLNGFNLPCVSTHQQQTFEQLVDYIVYVHNDFPDNVTINKELAISVLDEVMNAMVYEAYFPNDFSDAGIEIINDVSQMINHTQVSAENVLKVVSGLLERENPIRNNIKLMDIRLENLIMPIKTA